MSNNEDNKSIKKDIAKKSDNQEILQQNNVILSLEKKLNQFQTTMIDLELDAKQEVQKIYNRFAKDIEQCRKFNLEKIIMEFLPIVDSLECSVNLINEDISKHIHIDVIKKIKLSLKLFRNLFKILHISKINDTNVVFNPTIHEAMSIAYTKDVKPNYVVKVMQPGYILHQSRLLRPAMVVVSKI